MVYTILIYTRERARKNIAAKVSYFFKTKKIPSKKRLSSKLACNKELTLFVEVAAVSPLPTN
jgi:hypothetical protein